MPPLTTDEHKDDLAARRRRKAAQEAATRNGKAPAALQSSQAARGLLSGLITGDSGQTAETTGASADANRRDEPPARARQDDSGDKSPVATTPTEAPSGARKLISSSSELRTAHRPPTPRPRQSNSAGRKVQPTWHPMPRCRAGAPTGDASRPPTPRTWTRRTTPRLAGGEQPRPSWSPESPSWPSPSTAPPGTAPQAPQRQTHGSPPRERTPSAERSVQRSRRSSPSSGRPSATPPPRLTQRA
jgi:hypothetical protein